MMTVNWPSAMEIEETGLKSLRTSVLATNAINWRWVHVRSQPLLDIPHVAFDVAFGGKADMGFCAAHVCY